LVEILVEFENTWT
jgi:hypothetical protein